MRKKKIKKLFERSIEELELEMDEMAEKHHDLEVTVSGVESFIKESLILMRQQREEMGRVISQYKEMDKNCALLTDEFYRLERESNDKICVIKTEVDLGFTRVREALHQKNRPKARAVKKQAHAVLELSPCPPEAPVASPISSQSEN